MKRSKTKKIRMTKHDILSLEPLKVKKHQLARERSKSLERGPAEGGWSQQPKGKKGPAWTFGRLEYLSRCLGIWFLELNEFIFRLEKNKPGVLATYLCLCQIYKKTKSFFFGNSANALFRTQLVSEEDSPTKMSDDRWISSPGKDEPCEQMGRQGVGSTRSRSPKEGAPCSHPSTPAGKHLSTTCWTAHSISWSNFLQQPVFTNFDQVHTKVYAACVSN